MQRKSRVILSVVCAFGAYGICVLAARADGRISKGAGFLRIPFGDSVAYDAGLSWLAAPGRYLLPTNSTVDSFENVCDLLQSSGVRHVRERFSWREASPNPGEWSPGRYMENARRLEKRGIAIGGMFHDTPEYARPDRMLPSDLVQLFDFCRRSAREFGDRMEMWEYWNEPDVGGSDCGAWNTAAAVKAAALGFRAGGFKGILAPPSICQETRGDFDKTLYRNGIADYTDVFNFHTYAALPRYPAVFGGIRSFLSEMGLEDRAIVLTENGTNQEGESDLASVLPPHKRHSAAQERVHEEFAVKAQILTRMEGVLRNYLFVFCPYNEREERKDWGCMRRDGTLKPAVTAIKRLLDEVGSAELEGEIEVTDDRVRAFSFCFPDGSRKAVCWRKTALDDGRSNVEPCGDERHRAEIALSDGRRQHVVVGGMADYFKLTGRPKLVRTAQPIGAVGPKGGKDLCRSVILRADLDKTACVLGGNKSCVELKGKELSLSLEIWNFENKERCGRVVFTGRGRVRGLPDGEVVLPPRGKTTLALTYVQDGFDNPEMSFCCRVDGRTSSRLVIPVLSEATLCRECTCVELDWRNFSRWTRNASADGYELNWDEQEKALRFTFSWNPKRTDQWFFPAYDLNLPKETLAGAKMVSFEVKSRQDKVENDYHSARIYVMGKGMPSLNYRGLPPVHDWETRRVSLPTEAASSFASRLEFGGHPRGHKVDYFIRNIRIYREKKCLKLNRQPSNQKEKEKTR